MRDTPVRAGHLHSVALRLGVRGGQDRIVRQRRRARGRAQRRGRLLLPCSILLLLLLVVVPLSLLCRVFRLLPSARRRSPPLARRLHRLQLLPRFLRRRGCRPPPPTRVSKHVQHVSANACHPVHDDGMIDGRDTHQRRAQAAVSAPPSLATRTGSAQPPVHTPPCKTQIYIHMGLH